MIELDYPQRAAEPSGDSYFLRKTWNKMFVSYTEGRIIYKIFNISKQNIYKIFKNFQIENLTADVILFT